MQPFARDYTPKLTATKRQFNEARHPRNPHQRGRDLSILTVGRAILPK